MAKRLVAGLRRELPSCTVADRPEVVDGAWTVAVVLPPQIEPGRFVAATVSENVPWRPGSATRQVLAPFSPEYDEEQQEQLVLVAAKVLHYFEA